jgi:hypothetical protein
MVQGFQKGEDAGDREREAVRRTKLVFIPCIRIVHHRLEPSAPMLESSSQVQILLVSFHARCPNPPRCNAAPKSSIVAVLRAESFLSTPRDLCSIHPISRATPMLSVSNLCPNTQWHSTTLSHIHRGISPARPKPLSRASESTAHAPA